MQLPNDSMYMIVCNCQFNMTVLYCFRQKAKRRPLNTGNKTTKKVGNNCDKTFLFIVPIFQLFHILEPGTAVDISDPGRSIYSTNDIMCIQFLA